MSLVPIIGAGLAIGFLVAGCTGDGDPKTRASGVPGTASPTLEPTWPTGFPLGVDALKIGEPYYQPFGYRTDTVQQFNVPYGALHSKHNRPPSGTRWAGLRVETCADRDMPGINTFVASAKSWTLRDAQGSHLRRHRTIRSDAFASVMYPEKESVPPGDCDSGWVLWALPSGFIPTAASFDKAAGPPRSIAEWALPPTSS
jgi:hypothetical protein